MKKAVLFDLDGVLLDSWDFVYKAFEYTLKLHKHPLPSKEIINKVMGKPLMEFYKFVLQTSPKNESSSNESSSLDEELFLVDQRVELYAKTHREYQVNKIDLNRLFPNVKSVLKKLKLKGYVIGVVSNRSRGSLLKSIDLAKISKYIDIVVSVQDVKNPKPHKEHVLTALKKLKVKAENAYMVGDTDADILAGKNAGVKTIGVTYGFIGKDIKKFKPDFIIDNMKELMQVLKMV
ncbi:HAD-IIIA family hydrolase [Candidatus Daviesbacteria bacterium]|nr:HAD-IIIA family hydrolase [Candidatus Daviesbacteria bacterium]